MLCLIKFFFYYLVYFSGDIIFTICMEDIDDPFTEKNGVPYIYLLDAAEQDSTDYESFAIDETTGAVKLLKELDFETKPLMSFKVKLMDRGGMAVGANTCMSYNHNYIVRPILFVGYLTKHF